MGTSVSPCLTPPFSLSLDPPRLLTLPLPLLLPLSSSSPPPPCNGGSFARSVRCTPGAHSPPSPPLVLPLPRGLHCFALGLDLGNARTHSCVKLGYTVDRSAQVQLKSEPFY
jgi:hypothetical protein